MANTNAPFGLRAVRRISGNYGALKSGTYRISATYAVKLYEGDLVTMGSDGNIQAAGTSPGWGVFQGVRYVAADGKPTYSNTWQAVSTASSIYADVADAPDLVYQVQLSGTSFAQTNVGNTADFTKGSGSDSTGKSAGYISSPSTGAAQLKIVRIAPIPDNESGSDYAIVEVVLNEAWTRTGPNGV